MKLLSLILAVFVCCSSVVFAASGIVTVQSPAANASVGSPVLVHATYNGTATYMKLWVDHVAVIAQNNVSTFSYSATLAVGAHLLEVQAQDATSKTVYTTPVNIKVVSNTTSPSVTVQSPLANSTDASPVPVNATYSGTATYMKLWVDHVAVIAQNNVSTFNYSATLANGAHLLEVQAQDATSKTVYTTPVSITVAPKAASISISPATVSVIQGMSQQFTVSGATGTVTWSVTPSSAGSVSSAGLFIAGATVGQATISASDSGTKTNATAATNVVALAISPSSASVTNGGTQTYTSNAPALWTVSAGSITPSGSTATSAIFTAPPSAGTVTVTAAEGSFTATSIANVSAAPITISPKNAAVVAGQQQQFTSSDPSVNWTISPSTAGSIDNTGLFTAGTSIGSAIISATDSANNTSGSAAASVVSFAITPSPVAVATGGAASLKANAPAIWSLANGSGSISNNTTPSATAIYTAPTTSGSATIMAAEAANNAITTTDTVTVGALTVTPSAANTVEGQSQSFAANALVTWSSSCGTIDTTGLFVAPNVVGDCTITAAQTGSTSIATAVDHVTAPAVQGLNYTTWKNDNGHSGQQRNETVLTPSNVNSTTFGVKFSVALDGMVFAQPLYMSGLTINGVKHNVVFVATEHNSVYAFDADVSGPALWTKSFLVNGATTVPQANVGSTISPEVGITSTPVIDPGTGTLYVEAQTLESGTYVHRLHALDVTSGNELLGGPVVIAAPGFAAKEQLQRAALAIANGNVYVAFASHGDHLPYNGWVMAYSESTLALVASWNASPAGSEGGIWGGGGGLAVDSNGDIYVSTGNGSFNGTTQFSMSIVKLSPLLQVLDWYAPWDAVTQSKGDQDVGSGGVLVVPDQSGAFPHELIECGKLPQVYVMNRDNLGHQGATSDSQLIQELTSIVGGTTGRQAGDHCFMTPAYWEGSLYFIGNNDVIKQFTLDPVAGKISSTPTSKGSFTFIFPGAQPVTSSNGSTNGIVWAVDGGSPAQLHAFDATKVSTTLYTSGTLVAEKWAVPTVVDGKVFVAGKGKLFVFGLF